MEENKSEIVLSENTLVEKEEFIKLHEYIFHCGRMTCEFAIEMAKKLKEMRDEKLYLAAGIKTFGEYVSTMLGMKERQAYNYIKVYEELPEEFLHSNAKIGIAKLTLLASISSVDRDEIIENESIGDISVNELKEKIKELEKETEDIKASQKKQLEKLKKDKEKLKQEVESLKNAPKAIETVYENNPELEKNLNEKTKSLQDKEKELEKKQEEINTLHKKLSANDNSMIIFKLKFEEFQRKANELLQAFSNVPEDKKINCRKAIQAVLEGLKVC